ncbi:MAG: drug/metabolite transporter (DMT)-like permease [Gammaproteobacteria bacterium]|jgi:drug/metabolite transporter (DMT)-like permease
MASAATLAFLCLLASGLLDLVFKYYANRQRSRGMLIFGIGCVWAILQLTYIGYTEAVLQFNQPTLIYGVLAAIFVTTSNILLLECLGQLPISSGSTIYRLNTIPLVIIAFFFLDENIGLIKGFGIGAGLLTVILLYQPDEKSINPGNKTTLFLILIILASCIRALYGAVTKAGISNNGDANTMMLFAAIGWCLGGLLYAHFREHRVVLTADKLKYIPIAGILVFAIVWLLTTALTLGDASVVIPLANMGFVAAFLFSIILKLEQITTRKLVAIFTAVISIVLLSYAA